MDQTPASELPSREEMAAALIETLRVEPTGEGTFRADTPEWYGPRVFGGCVLGLAADAAIRLRPTEQRIHSLHAYFLRPVVGGEPVDLAADELRAGRTFTNREVTVSQAGKVTTRVMCSFAADEDGDAYQLPVPTDAGRPHDHVEDVEWGGPFEAYNAGATPQRADGSYEATRRVWLRLAHPVGDDAIRNAVLTSYISDLTETAFRPLSLGQWGTHTDASLDHAVWFHRPTRVDEWHFFTLHAVVNHAGRSVVRGELFDASGALCMSMAQELLIRPLA